MKCAVHGDADAVGYCRNCGKALCSICVRPVADGLYCEDCLAMALRSSGIAAPTPSSLPSGAVNIAGQAVPGRVSGASSASPSAAFFLGLFPGLGAVYNGEYNKALIHLVLVFAMIAGLSSDVGAGADVTLALLLTGFILYMAFDAMRTAKARQLGEVPSDPLESWSKHRPIGPIILIVLGAFFLLNNFDWFPFNHILRFWPVVLIAVGVLMFRNRLGRLQ